MNSCTSIRNDLDDYRDRMLEPDRQRQLRVHLQQCEDCRAVLEHADAVEAEIRSNAANWQPSEQLWHRIILSAQQDKRRQTGPRSGFAWMSAALLLITVSVTGYTLLQTDSEPSTEIVASALVNEFHTFVVSHRALDFNDTRPAEIRSWFGDKVDFRVPLPIEAADLHLAGGRLCNMLDQRIASFMYQVDGAWVSLYIMRQASKDQPPVASHELLLQGYAFINWESQGLHYSLVGDLPVERLRQVAIELRSTRILTRLIEPQQATPGPVRI